MTILVDEYWGQGGSYLLNPKTGKRTLIERTDPATTSDPTPEDLTDGPTGEEDLHSQQD
jgi:hypothetical protein